MNDRIEAFMKDVLPLRGLAPADISEATRRHLAIYEKLFRDAEVDNRKTDAAAVECRRLCRERVEQEIKMCEGTPTADHLRKILDVINRPARFILR